MGGGQSNGALAATPASILVAISGGNGAVLRSFRSAKALMHSKMADRLPLASFHKNLRFCDLCKELGFGCSCTHNALGAGSASQDRRLFGGSVATLEV